MSANKDLFRILAAIVAIFLIATACHQTSSATDGLFVSTAEVNQTPLTLIIPDTVSQSGQTAPAVIIAHGFSGSRQLMLGYAHKFAYAGYITLLLDFDGHAANPKPLSFGAEAATRDNSLQLNLDEAYQYLLTRPEVDPSRVSLLGHSMGSGAVMSNGIRHPNRYTAVLAISPTSANVNPELPRNLHIQAGQFEAPFIANGERLLMEAGDLNDNFPAGLARDFIIIPNVEHISILFSPQSHEAALNWLNQANNHQTAIHYQDVRIVWYAVNLLAFLILTIVLRSQQSRIESSTERSKITWSGWQWGIFISAPFLATGALTLLNMIWPMGSLGGMLVGGALALWFLVMGLFWLLLNYPPPLPVFQDFRNALFVFLLLTAAFGVLADTVWLPWFLISARYALLPFLALSMLPWLLILGQQLTGLGLGRRFVWWLGQTVLFTAALVLLASTIPGMGFIILVVPLLPAIIGIMMIIGSIESNRPWSFALANAVFFGWLIAALFPLAT